MNRALARLHTSIDMRMPLKTLDYVIEAVFERSESQAGRIFRELEEVCPRETILASNTSGIPVSLLASATRRPDKVIGTHFMNPVR